MAHEKWKKAKKERWKTGRGTKMEEKSENTCIAPRRNTVHTKPLLWSRYR